MVCNSNPHPTLFLNRATSGTSTDRTLHAYQLHHVLSLGLAYSHILATLWTLVRL